MMSSGPANPRDAVSLQNWLEETGCITREETAYLRNGSDLVSLGSSGDLAVKNLEDWVEDRLVRYYRNFRKLPGFNISANENVYVYSGSLVKGIATALMLFMMTFLLLTPIAICIAVDSIPARILIIFVSTAVFLTVLSKLTRSRMIELILAGAT